MYAPSFVFRVIQIMFLPSLCADRGPVAETDVGTVGYGRGGISLLIRCRFGASLDVVDSAAAARSLSLDGGVAFAESPVDAGLAVTFTTFGEPEAVAGVNFTRLLDSGLAASSLRLGGMVEPHGGSEVEKKCM